MLAALTEANARWISDDIDPATGLERLVPVTADYIQANHLMMLLTDYGLLDLFDFVPGHAQADVQEVFAQSVLSSGVRYASLEWLKRIKQSSDRPKDRSDLENL